MAITVNGNKIDGDAKYAALLFYSSQTCPICGSDLDIITSEDGDKPYTECDCVIHCSNIMCKVGPVASAHNIKDLLSHWGEMSMFLNKFKNVVDSGDYKK